MRLVNEILSEINSRFRHVDGTCEQHGPATVLKANGEPWHCPKCFEAEIIEKDRAADLQRRKEHLLSIASIPPKYIGQKFTPHTQEHKAVRGTARLFRDFIVQEWRWAALILVGKTGTGKTQLACEIGQAIVNNLVRSVRYTTSSNMIGEIRASYSQEGKSEEGEKLRFAQYDLLILDEIDAMRGSVNDQLLLNDVINMRYNNNKPVIVISNQPFEHLAQFVGDRVHSRLHENAFVCPFTWDDFRRQSISA